MLLILAASLALAATPDNSAEMGKKSLQYLAELMGSSDAEVRSQTAAAWGEIGNSAAVPLLTKALKDPNPYVRIEAACSLHSLGNDAGFPVIEAIILASTGTTKPPTVKGKVKAPAGPGDEMRLFAQNKVRAAAIGRFADIGGVRAAEIFEKTIDDLAPVVRDATAIGLARMGFDELDPVFIEMIKDKNEEVRAASAKALGQIGRPAAVTELRQAAEDPSPSVRAEAVAALGHYPDSGVLYTLTKALADKDRLVRANAVAALGKVPGSAAKEALFTVLKDTAIPAFTLKVMAALALRGDASVDLALVEKTLRQKDADSMLDAVIVLKNSKSDGALALLRQAFEDNHDPQVRLQAAVAIIKRMQKPQEKRR